MTNVTNIDPALGATNNAPAQAPKSVDSPRFQELLERLQKIAGEQKAKEEVGNPEELQDALRTADDGFLAAMDLRKQLEAAFKKHMS